MGRNLAAAVTAAYGLGAPLGPLVYADRGERGRIWRLDTRRGRWAVKEADTTTDPEGVSDAVAEAAAKADVAFQFAAHAAGVPLPLPVPRPDGRVLLSGAGVGSGGRLRVYEWVDLRPGAAGSGEQIGALAADLHRLDRPAAGEVDAWFAQPLGDDGWAGLLATAERARAWWAAPLRRLLPELVALEAAVRPPDPAATRTCHRDLNVDNVRLRPDGRPIVLDWENSGPLEPVRELGVVVAHVREDVSPEAAVSAYAAYRRRGGPHRLTHPSDFSTAIVLQGHLLRYYGERSLTAADAEDRRRADGRLRAPLARPLTRRALEQLLAAFAPYA